MGWSLLFSFGGFCCNPSDIIQSLLNRAESAGILTSCVSLEKWLSFYKIPEVSSHTLTVCELNNNLALTWVWQNSFCRTSQNWLLSAQHTKKTRPQSRVKNGHISFPLLQSFTARGHTLAHTHPLRGGHTHTHNVITTHSVAHTQKQI